MRNVFSEAEKRMKTFLKNAELVNTVIRKMMTIMFIAGKEMKNVNTKIIF